MSEHATTNDKGVSVITTDESLYPHVQFQECFVKELDSALYPYNNQPTLLKEFVSSITKILIKEMQENGVDTITLHFEGSGDSASAFSISTPDSVPEDFLSKMVDVFDYRVELKNGEVVTHSAVGLNHLPDAYIIKQVIDQIPVSRPIEDVVGALLTICLNESYGPWYNDDGGYGTVTLNRLGEIFIELMQVTVQHDYNHFSALN